MKIHLPLLLKSWLMLSIIAVAQAEEPASPSVQQGNITLSGTYDDTFEYLNDGMDSAVITLGGDSSFTPADRGDSRTFTSLGSLMFSGSSSRNLSFDRNTTTSGEGGSIMAGEVIFEKLGNISFTGNAASSLEERDEPVYGGAISVKQKVEIKGTEGNILFQNNRVEGEGAFGGAIAVTGNIPEPSLLGTTLLDEQGEEILLGVFLSGNKGSLSFIGNSAVAARSDESEEYYNITAVGGAIMSQGTVEISNNQGDILFSGNRVMAQGDGYGNVNGYGGAIAAEMFILSGNEGAIDFVDNAIIVQSNDDVFASGSVVDVIEDMEVHHNKKNISFVNNSIIVEAGYGEISGGAISTGGSFSMGWNKGEILFQGNSLKMGEDAGPVWNARGGAVCAEDGVSLIGNSEKILFERNTILAVDASGGAIYGRGKGNMPPPSRSAVFPEDTKVNGILISGNQKQVIFNENKAEGSYASGGAIFADGDLIVDGNVGDIVFSYNEVTGGLFYDMRPQSNYYGDAYGGAIYSEGVVRISGNEGNVIFEGNMADGRGMVEVANAGAIASMEGVSITGNAGDVWFIGNKAVGGGYESFGGAIYSGGDVTLGADRGNIYFTGNRMGSCGKANAIYMTGDGGGVPESLSTFANGSVYFLTMRATEGHKIVFEDGIAFSWGAFSIRLNEGKETGNIIFSGTGAVMDTGTGRFDEYGNGNKIETVLGGGTLTLEKGALYGAGPNPGVFHVTGEATVRVEGKASELRTEDLTFAREGSLDMAGGTVTADNSISLHYAQVVVSNGGRLNANYINMHGGLIYDLKSTTHLVVNPLLGFSLDGNLTIRDHGLDIYRTKKFTQNLEILVMHNGGVLNTGTLDEILSETSNSYKVGDSTTSQGYWTMEWRNDNKDLYAIWTVENALPNPIDPELPVFIEVAPEHVGNLVPNTLWSTVSNVNALGAAAMGQVGVARFTLQKDCNYWVTGLGDFSQHKAVGVTDGYEYNGGGYAVGADTRLTDKFVGGIAFGQLFGKNKSRGYSAEVDQKSYAGMLYGAWRNQIDADSALSIEGSVAYGYTDNTLDTYYSTGEHSHGSWDNNAYQVTLQGTWDYSLNSNWTLSPYAGVEYTDAEQDSFTESGDMNRRFGSSHLRNLSLPVGLGLTRLDTYTNGMKWVNGVTVSYVPDVYRENPESSVYRGMDNGIWRAKGVSAARNAVRVEFNTRLMLNANWSTFAGYELEGRSHAVYQSVNLGISASF